MPFKGISVWRSLCSPEDTRVLTGCGSRAKSQTKSRSVELLLSSCGLSDTMSTSYCHQTSCHHPKDSRDLEVTTLLESSLCRRHCRAWHTCQTCWSLEMFYFPKYVPAANLFSIWQETVLNSSSIHCMIYICMCIVVYCITLFWKYTWCYCLVFRFSFLLVWWILSCESQSHVKGSNPPAKKASSKWVFFLLMKVRRESHLSFCDNLSLSPVISFAPLILIVLYNCVMWTSWSLKYCPYPFIITWCLEPLIFFPPCSVLSTVAQ